MNDKPLIIAIDDDENEVKPKIPPGFDLEVIDPTGDETVFLDRITDIIDRAALILLDHKFYDQAAPLKLRAQDGASFVSHLRSWSRVKNKKLAPIIIFTNEENAFANEIPTVGPSIPIGGSFRGREYRLSPTLDVEWILYKADECVTERLSDLASAFTAAHATAGSDGASLIDIEGLLKLPGDAIWADRAREEVQNARPPVNEKQPGSPEPARGPSQIVRWLCQRALPYPGMLLSDLYAAWALGISIEIFRSLVDANQSAPWLNELRGAEYSGPLRGFLERRWWRAGIDQAVWKMDEEIGRVGARDKAFLTLAPGMECNETMSPSSHVVVWTEDLREQEIVSIDEAVLVHPPGWPSEAAEPWMRKDEVQHDPVLKAMADPSELV